MNEFMPFIVIGLVTGSLYALAGLGLVLTYRTTGIFNFGHGALAAASAYLFFTLHFAWRWPWPVAALIAVGLFGPVAGVLLERISQRLSDARTATIVVSTVGLFLCVQGFLDWSYGARQRTFPNFLPESQVATVGNVMITWAQVINVLVGLVSFLGLHFFLKRTRLGVAMRAVVSAPELASLTGLSPARVRRFAWVIGCSFAALTGILIAPSLSLNAALLSALVVQAFGAVAVGRFRSLPLTYLGGLAVGLLAAFGTKWFGARPPLNGLPASVPFLILIAVMVFTPARLLPREAGRMEGFLGRSSALPNWAVVGGAAVGVGLLVAIPTFVGARLPVYSTALILVILFFALSLLTRVSGQISLAHAAFAGIGAATFGHFTAWDYPWLVGLVGAGLAAGVTGAVVALPSMRLSGLYLALATFGFGLLMDVVVFRAWFLFGSGAGTTTLTGRRPDFGPIDGGSAKAFYYVVCAIVLVTCVALVRLRASRLGRFLRAMADSPEALSTLGLGVSVTRLIVFAVSAFFAGIAGALFMVQFGQALSVSFNSTLSIVYLAALTVAGTLTGFVAAPFLAAAVVVILPSYAPWMTQEVQSMLFGAAAILAALVSDGQLDWGGLGRRLRAAIARAAETSNERHVRNPMRRRSGFGQAGTVES